MAGEPLLKVNGLWSGYHKDVSVIKGIDLEVQAGEIVAIIGSNGAGKTTMLKTLGGLLPAARGEILFKNMPIRGLKPAKIVGLGFSQCPEGRKLFPEMTVLENLQMGAYLQTDKKRVQEGLARVFSLFPRLAERRRQLAGTLSGGEQQMVAIGRALMADPFLLALDEPSLGLAPMMVELLFDVVAEINRQGTSIILVEQNARKSLDIAHRGYVLESGIIKLSGTSQFLANNPEVERIYLGVS